MENQLLSFEPNMLQEEKCHTVVVQPTEFCNIDCSYCYLPNRHSTRKMDISTVKAIFSSLQTANILFNSCEVIWHASEPFVMPIDFYKNAFEEISKILSPDIKVVHKFQTNATLINDEWCAFIKEYSVEIGVSIDGPEHIHNYSRKDKGGKGTFARTIRGIKALQRHGIPFHIIAVITNYSLSHIEEIFNFFVSMDIMDLGFNVEEMGGDNKKTSLDSKESTLICRQVFSKLLELQLKCSHRVIIREFMHLSRNILFECESHHAAVITPYRILSFDIYGNFSTFCPELLTMKNDRFRDFTLGNVFSDPIRSLVHKEKFSDIYSEILKGVNSCKQNCEYFFACGGGSPSTKIGEHGTFAVTETMFCKQRIQPVIDVLSIKLEDVLLREPGA